MATIDMALLEGNGSHQSLFSNVRKVYVIDNEVDIADAVTAKGSALAAADVIQALNIPANSMILGGGLEVLTATTGTATDVTIDVGITGGDVDLLVDGFDLDGAAAGAHSANGVQTATVVATADTVDILIPTMTGTLLTGVVRVWAVIADIGDSESPGLAALGS